MNSLDNPLLQMNAQLVPYKNGSTFFPTTQTINPWVQWHVSLCFSSDPAYTENDLAYIMEMFHGTDLILQIEWAHRPTGSMLRLDTRRDPIASDPIVQKLHALGSYRNRDIHVSM